MTNKVKFLSLLKDVQDAEFDCGEHHSEKPIPYDELRKIAVKAQKALCDFVYPYLPKD